MAEENIANNRFIIWFSAVLIPVVGLGLYVYELFFKEASINKVAQPTTQSAQLPATRDSGKVEAMEKRLAEIQGETEQMCRNLDFNGAVAVYENNLPEFIGFPEMADRLKQELAGVYYKWAKMLKDSGEHDNNPGPVRKKLEQCLETAPQGKYAGLARELLERMK